MSKTVDLKVMTVGGHSFVVGKGARTGPSVRFRVSAKDLPDMDTIGSTDPYLKVYIQKGKSWELIGTSEVLKNSLNPTWSTVFEDKPAERSAIHQYWKIEVWDHDEVGSDDFVGETIVSISAFTKSADPITIPLTKSGTITLSKSN